MTHPIENMMRSSIEQIREMVDVNTIVGDPIITTGETMILPVSKLCLGFLSGGGEYQSSGNSPVKKSGAQLDEENSRYPFAGTSVAGLCITPMAFLSVSGESVKVLPAQYAGTLDRAIELIPESMAYISKLIKGTCNGSHKGAESN